LTDSVKFPWREPPSQVRNIADVTTASPTGIFEIDTVNVRGEILDLKEHHHTMVDQLSSFAAEVTRVAREVGTEASSAASRVRGVAGT